MEHRPALRRNRPPQEPGPRLLPIALGLALFGFIAGAGGKLLLANLHHPAVMQRPHATPSPNYALLGLHAPPAKLPPIPTPQGTWLSLATVEPRTSVMPRETTHATQHQAVATLPVRTVAPTAAPSPVPTAAASHTPTAAPSASAVPVAAATLPPRRIRVLRRIATLPVATFAPVHRRKVLHVVARETTTALSVATAAPGVTIVTAVAAPPPVVHVSTLTAPERVVHRYLVSLIRGDEAAAYSLLGAAPGARNVRLSEESFINTSAHITSVAAAANGAVNTVHAEIETAGGSYFGTYHTEERDGRLVIVDHDYIKL